MRNNSLQSVSDIGGAFSNMASSAASAINRAIGSINSSGTSNKKTPPNTGRYMTVKSSHTGSQVKTEGLVNVAPAELIVNPEISKGLKRIIEREKTMINATQNYFQQKYNNARSIQFNAPLYNVEKQEIADRADLKQTENDIVRTLDMAIAELV